MIFEYKVRARHRLGWKEFKLYADTDIEEFFNKNSIDYVRNMTYTVEHRQLKEIERLNNIIKRFEEDLREVYLTFGEFSKEYTEKKIRELKGEDKE